MMTDESKDQLEIEKLRYEARNARWCIPSVVQALPGIFLVVATFLITTASGILDVKRETLTATNERLQTQKLMLENEKTAMREQVDKLTIELGCLRSEVDAFQNERDSVKLIRKLLPESKVEYLDDEDGFKILLMPGIDIWETAKHRGGQKKLIQIDSRQKTAVLNALVSIRSVKILEIKHFKLIAEDLVALGSLHNLRSLSLHDTGIDDSTIASFPTFEGMRSLEFVDNLFTDFPTLSDFHSLKTVVFWRVPVTDNLVKRLRTSQARLQQVVLSSKSLGDQTAIELSSYDQLKRIVLAETSVTLNGLRVLATNLSIKSIGVSESPTLMATDVMALKPGVFFTGNFIDPDVDDRLRD